MDKANRKPGAEPGFYLPLRVATVEAQGVGVATRLRAYCIKCYKWL
jgi:hypothetical protein